MAVGSFGFNGIQMVHFFGLKLVMFEDSHGWSLTRAERAGVYRDKLKPLLDSSDAGHLLSIFSYTGEGACIEHVDRGFITLATLISF